MASRGRGRRERPRGTNQAQSVFDQRTFAEAVGITTNAIAQASIACRQEDPSNPQRFDNIVTKIYTTSILQHTDDHNLISFIDRI